MAQILKGAQMASANSKQHSSRLRESLTAVAKSLSSRPQELRGPFAIKSAPNIALKQK